MRNMTREDFMELFDLTEGDDGLDYADEQHENGETWFEIAKATIATMNMLLNE